MSSRLRTICLFIALASAAVPGAAALAADLDGYGAPPLPEQKVEFGSGWYVRGDIAATDNYSVDVERVSTYEEGLGIHHNSTKGYDLSLGGGYNFLNGIRADITADFHQPATSQQVAQPCITVMTSTCDSNGKFASYDVLVNGYYDLGTWYRVTPYVGAGVGVGFGSISAGFEGDPAGPYIAKDKYQNLAFAFMSGVAIDVFDHTKLDIGYRYLDNGRVASTHVYFQQIRAGLRYMIDN